MKTVFHTQDREAGNRIETFDTIEEAREAIAIYEDQDKSEGTFTPDFYEVAEDEVMDCADDLIEAADVEGIASGLKQITTTTELSGYPAGLRNNHLHGFETFEQAEKFVAEFGGTICLYEKRDGQSLWYNRGRKYEPLTCDDYVKDLGDDYAICGNAEEEYESWCDLASEYIRDGQIDQAIKFLQDCNELKNEIEACEEGRSVIRSGNQYVETVDNEMMSYHEDATTYVIGVELPI